MAMTGSPTTDAVIGHTLNVAPEISVTVGGATLCRWRRQVSNYMLPALPGPVFALHHSGKPSFSVWNAGRWSDPVSKTGCVSFIPPGIETGWRVDGCLDTVTVSLAGPGLSARFNQGLTIAEPDLLAVELGRQILAEADAPRTANRDRHIRLLLTTLSAHLRCSVTPDRTISDVQSPSDWRIRRAEALMFQAPHEAHPVEQLAAAVGLAPSHFAKLFKRVTGLTPHVYLMKLRIEKAQLMLVRAEAPIGNVAAMLGFASQGHFTRTFQAAIGQTPSTYRNRMRARG